MNNTIDRRALAARPVPTLTLNNPLVYAPDSATSADWQALCAASRRYASRLAAQVARLLQELFPAVHQVVFDRDEDVFCGVQATLLTIRDSRGLLLWHDPAFAAHPDAVALAEAEAYGGPVRPRLDDLTRSMLEALIEDADRAGPQCFFPSVDGPSGLGLDRSDLRELIVSDLLARRVPEAANKATPPAAYSPSTPT